MFLFALPLISLFFFPGFAVAQITAPACNSTWKWSFNSLGQNPCTVAAYMLSTCSNGSYTIDALPAGYSYYLLKGAGLCLCNTIAYSLYSACDGCQGSDWISWSDWAYNCTTTLPPSSFPNPIPAGTSLPRWVLLFDVTSENIWNETNAIAVGDSPELGPGTILGSAGPSVSFSSSTGPSTTYPPAYTPSSQTTIASPSHTLDSSLNTTTSIHEPGGYRVGGHSSNTGAIAGSTVGGIAAMSIVAVALFFYWKRRRSLAQSAPFTVDGQAGEYNPQVIQVLSQPMSGQETVTPSFPRASTSLLRPHNSEDPFTFPEHQGAPNRSFTSVQASPFSNTRHVYTVATPPSPEAWE